MTTIAFDTLKFTRKLRDAGVPENHAEAIVSALGEAQGEAGFASRDDLKLAIADLRTDLIKWMVGLAMGQTALLIGILLKIS